MVRAFNLPFIGGSVPCAPLVVCCVPFDNVSVNPFGNPRLLNSP